ncbi:hypothetical protein BCR36DRAFT_585101 [Piromyces finnis]|uniref:Uncharacterized protein n=1 Tax=Piromyces finnis TaxID=1754191 RepID=A0A1Y1V3T7_9FUNG|nr:hypothetical protein BCR36DRAFT_585101 [Piromyces finnis]|eukprot:ORX46633.1 hypothetical protein BCR36DRAFT_585101 [Piromyces finnis]
MIEKVEKIDTSAPIEENDSVKIQYEERLLNQLLRNKLVIVLNKIVKLKNISFDEDENKKANKILSDYIKILTNLKYKTKYVKNLLIDITNSNPNHGQVEKAISILYYGTWGKCYINSFLRFHQYEQCGNFKDQSLQYYTHEVFNAYRKMANTIFVNLPPPETEEQSISDSYNSSITSMNARNNPLLSYQRMDMRPSINETSRCLTRPVLLCDSASETCSERRKPNLKMKYFINRHGGCFNGDACILLANYQKKRVRDLKKGDLLNNNAAVKCVIEQTLNEKRKPYMCDINGVLLTPYHPIAIDNNWYFPNDLVNPKEVSVNSWFNVILQDDNNQKYEIEFDNGIKAITLGHNRDDNNILKHPYFGSELVLKDLKERDPIGYSNGYIHIKELDFNKLEYDENQFCMNYYKTQDIKYEYTTLKSLNDLNDKIDIPVY